jgi:ATP-binding cassette, subfamily C, bacteriocin exporter
VLSQLSYPAIAHTVLDDGGGHFVVVEHLASNKLKVMDPAVGSSAIVAQESFLRQWTGVIILAIPGEHFHSNQPKPLLKQVLGIVRPVKNTLLLLFVCSLLYAAISFGFSVYLQKVIDEAWVYGDLRMLRILSTSLLLTLIVQFVISVVRGKMMAEISRKVDMNLLFGYVRHVVYLPKSFFDSMQKGEIISRLNDATRMTSLVSQTMFEASIDLLTMLMSLAIMFAYSWRVALIIMILIPVYAMLFVSADKIHRVWQRKIIQANAAAEGLFVQTLTTISTLKQVCGESFMVTKLGSAFKTLMDGIRLNARKQVLYYSATDLCTKVVMVIALWAGIYLGFSNVLTKGEVVTLFSLMLFFTGPAVSIAAAGRNIRESMISAERYFDVMSLGRETTVENTLRSDTLRGNVEFREVTFGYPNGVDILHDYTVTIHECSITGIYGQSGSGKSTLGLLLLGIYTPQKGRILINGVDISSVDVPVLRNSIAVVPQDIQLLNTSIQENICLGPVTDEDWFNEVVQRSGVAEIANLLPNGFHFVVSGEGINLSGGQKRKIAFARALYKKAPFLLLDEPTSGLDEASEQRFMQTLQWYKMLGNTVIIITHSDIAIKICDNIVLFKNSRPEPA